MIEIPVEQYHEMLEATREAAILLPKWVGLWKTTMFFWAVHIIASIISIIKTRPNKETRKRIKALANEKHVSQYVISNRILETFFEVGDEFRAKKLHEENKKESFEEWKANKEAETATAKKQIVKPRKVHPGE